MALPERQTPVSRPTYTNRLNVSDVREYVNKSLKNQYGHKLLRGKLKALLDEHAEFKSSIYKPIVFGVLKKGGAGKATVERYRVKHFLDTLAKTVRNEQQEAMRDTMKPKVSFTVAGRKGFREPKGSLKKLTLKRIESVTPSGPTKAEVEQQQKLEMQRHNIQQYERNKELREEINTRLFGQTSARTSVFKENVMDPHAGAKTSSTDYRSIPVSVADYAKQKQEPMGSASEHRGPVTEFNPQARAVGPDDDTKNNEENSADSVDDDLPLAA